jgi:collagen triple helix repeat protein
MFSMIRRRLTYTNVAMTFALIFAMTGGAYAAKHYVITSTKQISPNVLKTLRGSTGPNGKDGANGVNGKDGTNGVNGKDGANGVNGKDGVQGQSVTSRQLTPSEAACAKQGGTEFTAAEGKKTTACDGAEGKEGSPWTVNGTLPGGKTETGEWAARTTAATTSTAISFAIPLKTAPESVVVMKEKEPAKEGCKGAVDKPEAEPGNLCLFEGAVLGTQHLGNLIVAAVENPSEVATAGTNGGTLILLSLKVGEETSSEGTWAVTAK